MLNLFLFVLTVRPLEVTLLGSNQPMSALQEIEIVCQSVGSRPPAEIMWFRDGQHLKSSREEVNHLYYYSLNSLSHLSAFLLLLLNPFRQKLLNDAKPQVKPNSNPVSFCSFLPPALLCATLYYTHGGMEVKGGS